MDLSRKIAVVTGGSKGMGFAIIKQFLSQGADVVFCDNDQQGLTTANESLSPQKKLKSVLADVSIESDMKRLMRTAVEQFSGIDILVNAAGIQRYGTVQSTSEKIWDEVFNVNVKGVFLASKFAIPEIEKRGGGAIINIASVQAYASQTNVAAYTATKGAIVAMTRAMALDHVEQSIRVNVICPASIDTPMLRWAADLWKGNNTAEETLESWGKGHPIGRVGKPEEVAALANFLASDLCPFMTGADLKLDGGVLSKLGIILPD